MCKEQINSPKSVLGKYANSQNEMQLTLIFLFVYATGAEGNDMQSVSKFLIAKRNDEMHSKMQNLLMRNHQQCSRFT